MDFQLKIRLKLLKKCTNIDANLEIKNKLLIIFKLYILFI